MKWFGSMKRMSYLKTELVFSDFGFSIRVPWILKYSLYSICLIGKTTMTKEKRSDSLHCVFFLILFLMVFLSSFSLGEDKLWNRNTVKPKISNVLWGFITINKQNTLMKLKLVNPQNFQRSRRKGKEATHFNSRCSSKGNPGHQKNSISKSLRRILKRPTFNDLLYVIGWIWNYYHLKQNYVPPGNYFLLGF